MSWDDTQISTDSISYTEWNNMVTFIKTVIASASTIIGTGATISGLTTIDQNADLRGLYIDSEATTLGSYGAQISTGQGATALGVFAEGNNYALFGRPATEGTGSHHIYRNITAADTGGPVVFIEQDHATDDQAPLFIQNDGTGDAVSVLNKSTGDGIFIDQNGNGVALNIDSEATTGNSAALRVTADQGAKPFYFDSDATEIVQMYGPNAAALVQIYRNKAAADTAGPLLLLQQDNAADDQDALKIQQDGTGKGVFIDQNGAGLALHIDQADTNQSGIFVDSSAVFVGTGVGDSLISARLDNGASTGNVQEISNDGTGKSLSIDQNGNGVGLNIDSEATTLTNYGLQVQTGQGAVAGAFIAESGNSILLGRPANQGASGSNHFYRNITSASTAGPVMFIEQDNAGDDQPALKIQNDGTGAGISITQLGVNDALLINAVGKGIDINASTSECINFSQSSDVEVLNFDACSDGGTTRTAIAGSLKVEMPNGVTGYINFYNAP